ncbi:hypothetical protein [Streptomyces poonensis]|uniref:Uncharacterized protein n=1 Tax=Streptomyces poonensis TaxID=68255 RepID=A0A918UWE7_9ACTN|nr:hypothetical protein [Streptomyces poonensis]GGZ40492.1 hypothetical protein GCM10010365_71560 [Streptomyces poonensis]GLJ93033.1 hypothetical protein GCM10017589_56450 [Streptomyces poonensis]
MAHSVLQRTGFIPVVRVHNAYHRAPTGLGEDDEIALATEAVARLRAVGYHVDCDEDFDTKYRPVRDLPLGASVTHLAERIRQATTTEEVAAALTELTASHDGILAAIREVIVATAEFHDSLGATTAPCTARRLRYLADEYLHIVQTDLAHTRNAIADRHAPHPSRSTCTQVVPPLNGNGRPSAPAHRLRARCRHLPRPLPGCAADPLIPPKETMHDHVDKERLVSFADVLAGELPDTWASAYHSFEHKDDLAELTDRIWDLDLVAESLAQHPLQHAAVLTRKDGAQLAILDRHDERDGFLIAAVAPRSLSAEAYRGIAEPNGIALSDDPFLGAELVTGDLLARYDAALAQARYNAAATVHPSHPDRVVLTWQSDGSLAAVNVGDTASAVLTRNGFVHDEQTGIYRLMGIDTFEQARAVREVGRQLTAQGIDVALQHPSGRIAPTVTPSAAPPTPVTVRSTAARSR